MKTLHNEDIRSWYASEGKLAELSRTIGQRHPDGNYLENQLGVPFHLRWIMEKIAAEDGEIPADALESIPFYSLCRGLFLPLS